MTASIIKDRVAIVGLGETSIGKLIPQSETELACFAIKAALDDAGITPEEVDGLTSFKLEATEHEDIARYLGMGDVRFFALSSAGGGGGCSTVGFAAMAIATGQCDVAVAWRSRKRSGAEQRSWNFVPKRVEQRGMWMQPFGIMRPADELAMLFRRYMHEYGGTREHLCNVAMACRSHANRKPTSIMFEKSLDRETYFGARWVSDPLCLYDCCLETDMAQAVVLVSAERAQDLRHKPVYIHSFAQGITSNSSMLASCFGEDPLHTQGYVCAERLYRHSDFKPADISVAQIYDSFTPWVLLSLEAYGFCGRGEGGPFSENGALQLGGRLPVNTGGGSLSDGYSHGYNHIIEGVKQMRGNSTSQVENAQACLVTSSDGAPTGALLLRN